MKQCVCVNHRGVLPRTRSLAEGSATNGPKHGFHIYHTSLLRTKLRIAFNIFFFMSFVSVLSLNLPGS